MFASNTMMGAALMALVAPAFSHMIMREPKPFGNPNNSPLDPSGADFPCKIGTVAFTGTATPYKSGDQAVLGFTGSAVHGGGSCQVSITSDKVPTKDSKFKVIYSIEGGCPSYVPGNLPENANGNLATNFTFAIPKEVPSGDMTLAFSWQNKIGQREYYMNCAPISVSGGATDTKEFDALPDMAVANIASQGSCRTTETYDYLYDNPGKYVIRNGTGPYMPLCGGAVQKITGEAAPERLGEDPVEAAPSGAPASQTLAVTPSAAPSSAPPAQASSAPPAVQSSSVPTPSEAPPAPSSAPPASPPVVAPSPPAASPPAAGGGTACPSDGAIVCNGEDQFALCDHGKATFMPVAAGTKCSGGAIIAKRDYTHRNARNRV
ncbi:hypothetical protein BDV96DRAFT_641524 [Lophiotrema nucula]|uniref:Carbohydrate-binding module family 19 domain-containing protein n=1 Tax=Lophiotrema nucula TaxID=690887 RepID=A0A6A5ZPV9_9PLEO|nr:hypothetical protein BDV96DRAFT_641524 [Lophiotrema nucula]